MAQLLGKRLHIEDETEATGTRLAYDVEVDETTGFHIKEVPGAGSNTRKNSFAIAKETGFVGVALVREDQGVHPE